MIADAMDKLTGKTYYHAIAYDTVATIINDLTTVGATPLIVNAYWAIGSIRFLQNSRRMTALIKGWEDACTFSGSVWGGGETPTLKGIINPDTIVLTGSAVGIIPSKKLVITESKLRAKDRILLLKSSGINANAISLARAVAKRLPKEFATKMKSGKTFGEALLSPLTFTQK